jgi:predicted nucleic acid-binding protein
MLDTNVVDHLMVHDDLMRVVERLVGLDQIELLLTHIQIDEVLETPESNPKRRTLIDFLGRLPASRVPTAGFIIGRSRIGHARLGDDEGRKQFEELRRGNLTHTEDAAIAATASVEGAVLVSCEGRKGRAVERARSNGIESLHVSEWEAELRALYPSAFGPCL